MRALGTLFNWLMLLLLGAVIGGFVLFVYVIRTAEAPADLPQTAGIVAFTGGPGRIEKALELLDTGAGKRLLISGVHPDTTAKDLAAQYDDHAALFDCCVDLDIEALDTTGNARETSGWATENGFDTLLVVTSDWHLPRSLLELRHRSGDRRLVGVPVRTDVISEGLWLSNSETVRRLVQEYAKYILALVRENTPSQFRDLIARLKG